MAKHRKAQKQAPPTAMSSWLSAPEQSVCADRAKHLKRRRPPALILAGTAAAALVFGHATDTTVDSSQIELTSAFIGIGGRGDPTAARIPAKINHSLVPEDCTTTCFIPVEYPASFFIDSSVEQGVPVLRDRIAENYNPDDPDDKVIVIGYSEGTLVAEEVRRTLDPAEVSPEQLSFIMIASPNVPNGGIYGRFPHLNLLILSSNGPAQPSQYNTTYYTNEYDPYADFPAYFNPLSLANSLVAVFYVHPDKYYDTTDLTPQPAGPAYTKVVTNSAGGTDTYILVMADHLPLYQPLRDLSNALGIAFLTDPLLDATEPLVRLLVDMGYTDRDNLNPEVPTRFRLITPPARIVQTLVQVPHAIEQGANNVVNGPTPMTSSTPFTATSDPKDTSSFRAAAQPQVEQQPVVTPKPTNPAPEDNSAPQPTPPSSTPPSPPTTPPSSSGSNPFTISPVVDNGSKTAPDNTKTRRVGEGRLINAVQNAVTNVFGGKPKPSTPKPSTPKPSTQLDAAPSPSSGTQSQQSPAASQQSPAA